MKFMFSSLLVFVVSFSSVAGAAELHGAKFEDKMTVDGKELVLNGLGLRTVSRFGLTIKVYVMGLYLPKKQSDAKAILASTDPKFIKMIFLRHVDSKSIRDGWRTGFLANCGTDCEAAREELGKFNDLMSDMRSKKTITIAINQKKVSVDVQGHKAKSAVIEDEAFARALPKIWLGDSPPNEGLKKGILGL